MTIFNHKRVITSKSENSRLNGFTLVELLVTTIVGSLLAFAGVSIYVQSLRASVRVIQAQQLRDQWARIALLMNADIAESCSATAAGSTLTLRVIPGFANQASIQPDAVIAACAASNNTIVYTAANGSLTRTGPAINANGTLNFANTATNQVLADNATQFTPVAPTLFTPSFQLTLSGPLGLIYSGDETDPDQVNRPRVRTY